MSLVLGVLLLLAGASPAAADVSERLTRTIPVTPGVPVTLQVTVGHVKVTGWDRPEVAIDIVRRAPDAAMLARLPARVDSATAGVDVRVLQTEGGHDPGITAEVSLHVPADAQLAQVALFEGGLELSGLTGRVSARVERGDVVADSMAGAIRLETVIGDIRLTRSRLVAGGVIRLRTFNGDVLVALAQRPPNARVLALTLGGTITSDLPLMRKEKWGPRWGEATIGTGDLVLSIDVVNGNITIQGGG
jgi:DUF4097 and DUF4098 domain-containing protein YvlB